MKFIGNKRTTDAFGQFQDRGDNYRPVIFVKDDEQRRVATESKAALVASGRYHGEIVTQIEAAQPFYVAEAYHQDFYKKNPERFAQEEADRAAYQAQQTE